MKRIWSFLFLVMILSGGVWAGTQKPVTPSKFDKKLEQQRKSKPNDTVRVIIQTRDETDLPNKVSKGSGKVLKKFKHFPGSVVEMKMKDLEAIAKESSTVAISMDEPVVGASILDGLESPATSSGGSLARSTWSATGAGIGIAIVDSGIATHSDLQNVVKRVDFTGGNGGDAYGHGTHVAGIAAGSGSASAGAYAGIAPGARLVDLRALDGLGRGYTSNVIAAVDWAIENRNAAGSDGYSLNIRVINLSLGHRPMESAETDPLAVACRRAVQAGIVVVAASGNYGKNAAGDSVYGTILSPGFEPSVITVGAVTTWGSPSRSDDVLATYSSKGPSINGLLKPDIAAPGSRMVAASAPGNYLVTSHPEVSVGNGYMKLSGTSMATPVVAGAAAMILSKAPGLTPNAVKAILMFTAERKGEILGFGSGEINIAGAMDLAMNLNPALPAGQYWVKHPALLGTMSNVINGSPVLWGRGLIWKQKLMRGSSIFYNLPSWAQTIVWGETIAWDESLSETIVWGETIAWGDEIGAETIVWGETIAWDDEGAQTIAWDDEGAQTVAWDEQ